MRRGRIACLVAFGLALFAGLSAGATVRPERLMAATAFATSVTPTPATLSAGTSVSLAVSVWSAASTTVLIDVEVHSPGGARVYQQWFDGQWFNAGQTRAFPATWQTPVSAQAGTYSAQVGIFTPGWGVLLYWNNAATTFSIGGAAAGGYTTAATAAPAAVTAGTATTITASTTSSAAGSVLVDLEVRAPGGARVYQQWFDGQWFNAGQTRAFTATWQVPAGETPGTHVIQIGIFGAGWGTLFSWNNAAGSISVSAAAAGASRTIAAFGDTGVNVNAGLNVNLAVSEGSWGYLGLGDYDYGAGAAAWQTQMGALLRGGCLCAMGNHDAFSSYAALLPGQSSTWSVSTAGVRVIGLDTNQSMAVGSWQWNWLVGQLQSAPEMIKIVTMHKPWWLQPGAVHPGTEFPGDAAAMEDLMVRTGVALVLSGHEHNYQRSVRGGVAFAVVGTGGQAQYAVAGAAPGTVATYSGFGHLLLTLSAGQVSARFMTISGAQQDAFTVTR